MLKGQPGALLLTTSYDGLAATATVAAVLARHELLLVRLALAAFASSHNPHLRPIGTVSPFQSRTPSNAHSALLLPPPTRVARICGVAKSQRCTPQAKQCCRRFGSTAATRMNCAGRLFLRRLPHPLLGPRLSACRTDCLWAWQHQQQHLQRQRLQQRSVQYTCGALAAQQAAASPALPPAASPTVTSGGPAPPLAPVSFDYTTLVAATAELQAWVPAKVEAVVQQEAGTALRLRTVADSGAAARMAWHGMACVWP